MDRRPLSGTGIAAVCLAAAACGTTTVIRGPIAAPPTAPPSTVPSARADARQGERTTAPSCAAGQLAVSTAGSAAAAGRSELMVKIANRGPGACLLVGYPQVLGRLPSGTTVRGHESEQVMLGMADPQVGASRVVLAPGEAAWLPLNFDDTPPAGAAACPAFDSISVTPPGVGRAYTVSAGTGGNAAPDCGGIQVPPVLAAEDAVPPRT